MKNSTLRVVFAIGSFCCAAVAQSTPMLNIQFPGPSESTLQRNEALASFRLAVGPFAAGTIAMQQTEGNLDQRAWRVEVPRVSTLELIQSLRSQIAAAGFKVIFECETKACGGYDFRFGTEVVAEPDMHVDLGDFRYLAAERAGPKGKEYLGLLVSKSPENGYVQLTRIGGETATLAAASPQSSEPAAQAEIGDLKPADAAQSASDLGARLDLGQAQVLEDLVFTSGSSELADGKYASLVALAGWLNANPTKTVALVGHTDASGGLASNTALSKKRAESVRQVLVASYGATEAQISADGVGPLAPRASNLTPDGQQKNRRVEVVPTLTPE
ncbi:MAG: OmpA family protein [Cypionkella sp.]|nr:OmpA family protein [Cypionkella sp.]